MNVLQGMLDSGVEKGFIKPETSTEFLSELLLAGWEGFGHTKARFGVTKLPYANIDKKIAAVNNIILKHHITSNHMI